VKNIVILISGGGSNMQAIVQASVNQQWFEKYGAKVAGVISNRPVAQGLSGAAALGIASRVVDHTQYESRAAFENALMAALDAWQPALVVLAGFMRILTPDFVGHYAGRLVNIHPSLLPAFTGLNTHQRAIDAGCSTAGATVHMVTNALDHGLILARAEVPVLPGDTKEKLAARVLVQEHLLYPRAIAALLQEQQHLEKLQHHATPLNPN
jgi:phosphoribosylglycinamide formyltransferase 1